MKKLGVYANNITKDIIYSAELRLSQHSRYYRGGILCIAMSTLGVGVNDLSID
ncbi:hypothetical protein [Photobacterium carnosum]|uniref:hypothetical protein n=1 Tax=Photobacterium carnosum TaxID=2023717 RepID=UPI001E3679E6|nr:hypothetical protein [Photobacterium carnosum]MCF2162657.1 hypothetical protein [Photobacterium carnosum]